MLNIFMERTGLTLYLVFLDMIVSGGYKSCGLKRFIRMKMAIKAICIVYIVPSNIVSAQIVMTAFPIRILQLVIRFILITV